MALVYVLANLLLVDDPLYLKATQGALSIIKRHE